MQRPGGVDFRRVTSWGDFGLLSVSCGEVATSCVYSAFKVFGDGKIAGDRGRAPADSVSTSYAIECNWQLSAKPTVSVDQEAINLFGDG